MIVSYRFRQNDIREKSDRIRNGVRVTMIHSRKSLRLVLKTAESLYLEHSH